MIVKHLYQRTIIHSGKQVKAWYFWYYDEDKKQIRKSCGSNGKPCLTKKQAEIFLANINDNDLIPTKDSVTFNDFCRGMFDLNSKYLLKCKNKGRIITEKTRKMKEHNLKMILEKFGNLPVDKVSSTDFDNWLLEFDRSNSWRNSFLETANDVYKELYAYHLIDRLPVFERFKVPIKSTKGILYPTEITSLFPHDEKALCSIWNKDNGDPEFYTYMFATMFFLLLTTGMRSGEIQALQSNQFLAPDTIILNAMISDGERVDHLKKGTEDNKKWRVVILPDRAVQMLEHLKTIQVKCSDYVFEYHGKPVSGNYLNKRFKYCLNNQGINTDERNLSIHSLRFTNDTMSLKEISKKDLKLMLGHTQERMEDYYDRSTALDHLPELMANKDKINSLWT
ncbi:MAG: tyrosine-type recombinase/integrase [Treponema sp.]|nr:tyrosine-type recombinase/integrase [Treponema sp.]